MGSTCPSGTHGHEESPPHPVAQNLTLPLRLDLALRDFQGVPGIDDVFVLVGEVVGVDVGDELFAVLGVGNSNGRSDVLLSAVEIDEGAVEIDEGAAVEIDEGAVEIDKRVVVDIQVAEAAEVVPVHNEEIDELITDFISFLCSEMLFAQSSFALRRRDEVYSCFLTPFTQSVVGTKHALID